MTGIDTTEAWMNEEEQNERQLWAAVIFQAIEDAIGKTTNITSPRGRELAKHQARTWLLTPNKDFSEVCYLAGYHPDRIRAAATKLIEEADQNPKQKLPKKKPKAKNTVYTHNGRSMTIREWSKETGVKYDTIYDRLNKGLSIAEAIKPGSLKPGRKATNIASYPANHVTITY